MRYLTFFTGLLFAAWLGWPGCGPGQLSPPEMHRGVEVSTRDSLPRSIDIYLPAGYHTESKVRYPVVYMMDGQYLFTPDSVQPGGVSWGLDTLLDQWIAAGEVAPCIVVGVHNTYRRIVEYMPDKGFAQWPDSTRQRFTKSYAEPEGDWFLEILVRDVKAHVDSAYRTLPDPGHTFIGGSVSGGVVALYGISEYPDVFSGMICMSGHWAISPGNLFPDAARAMLGEMGGNLPDPSGHKLYFDYGTEGMDAMNGPYQAQMDSLVRASGYQSDLNWMSKPFPGDASTPEDWGARFHIPLKFMLSGEGR
jgi:hypothetical protein